MRIRRRAQHLGRRAGGVSPLMISARASSIRRLTPPARLVVAEEQRADRQQAVEPAARLVDGFADEIGGELVVEMTNGIEWPIRSAISPLSKWHRSAVEPAVDHLAA